MEKPGRLTHFISRNLNRIMTTTVVSLVAGIVTIITNSKSSGKEACETLQNGDVIKDDPNNLPAKNSIEALEAACAQQGVQLTRKKTAEAILKSIQNGVDVSRGLVEDARAIQAQPFPEKLEK